MVQHVPYANQNDCCIDLVLEHSKHYFHCNSECQLQWIQTVYKGIKRYRKYHSLILSLATMIRTSFVVFSKLVR